MWIALMEVGVLTSGAMSYFSEEDEPMHYFDGSHRWLAPDDDTPQDVWEATVRAHVARHRRDDRGAFLPPRGVNRNAGQEPRRGRPAHHSFDDEPTPGSDHAVT